MKLAFLALSFVFCLVAFPSTSQARIERHAILIGNNRGAPDELPLRYAESDASKMHDVLKDLGGFPPEDMVLLRGEGPEVVRRALIAMNDRIRSLAGDGDREVFFVVYYSGHSDAEALHLGRERLAIRELEQLVRGSAAAFRLLVVDACRSGALTQVKGAAARTPAFPIVLDQRLAGQGAVFWSSSAVNEDAQESDELKGSFFTHYLVSGLLGAADEDGDGTVVLEEAYQYAYQNTLRASSRTLAGLQHPTYRYEVRGRGGMAITQPGRHARRRATIRFPHDIGFLLFEGQREGAVTGEVGARDLVRKLSVKPGAYFVRGRGPGYLLEGTVELVEGQELSIDHQRLERIEYARLARKGGAASVRVQGPVAGYLLRSPLEATTTFCQGVAAGWAWAGERLALSPRLGVCRATSGNEILTSTSHEIKGELRVSHAWDFGRVALDVAATGGVGLLQQSYETRGVAPDRLSLSGVVGVGAGGTVSLGAGFYAIVESSLGTYFFRTRDSHTDQSSLATRFAWQTVVGLGKFWSTDG